MCVLVGLPSALLLPRSALVKSPLPLSAQPTPSPINDHQKNHNKKVGRKEGASVLVSAKEEGDLSELLGMFELGLGELGQFSERLQVSLVFDERV